MRAETGSEKKGQRHGATGPALLVTLVWLAFGAASAQAAQAVAGPGSGAGKVDRPLGVAVDNAPGRGELYVADANNLRIDEFDSEGDFLLAWGFGVADDSSAELQSCGPSAEPPTVRCFAPHFSANPAAGNVTPEAVVVDQSSHDIYVADGGRRRVTKFGPSGEFVFMIGKEVNPSGLTAAEKDICTLADLELDHDECGAGQSGAGAGEFFATPSAMSVDASGRLWVLDGERIDEFDSAGAFLSQVPVPVGPPAAKGLARNSAGDFYTVREGKDERQEVAFSGFAEGDTFELGNLPAACSGSNTGPIAFPGLSNQVQERELEADLEAALGERCGEKLAVAAARRISFVSTLAAQNFQQLSCTKLSGAGSCSVSTLTEGEPGTVEELDPLGAFLKNIYSGGPEALAIDAAGDLYVGDKRDYHFLRFDPAGELVSSFGAGQVATDRFGHGPRGNAIALGEANGALYAANGISGEEGAVQRFALHGEGPLPENLRAEDVLPSTATLAATLNPEGHSTEYRFEYLTQHAYEEQGESFEGPATHGTEEKTLAGTEFEEEEVSAAIEGLAPETAYRFRILAANAKGEAEAQAAFTTRPAVAIEAQWASEVAARSAAVHAKLDPLGGEGGRWWLEYGTAPCAEGGCARSEEADLPESFGEVTVGVALGGLDPDTTYHYRFAAKDERPTCEAGECLVHGADLTFTTQPAGLGFALADERAWEMVSPPQKFGASIGVGVAGEGQIQAAADGNAIAYLSAGSIEGAPAGNRAPERSSVLSRRGAGGAWDSLDLTPPNAVVGSFSTGRGYEYKLFSTNLSEALLEPRTSTPLSPQGTERTPYVRSGAQYTPLLSGAEGYADVPSGLPFGGSADQTVGPANAQGATAGLSHVVLASSVPLACHEAAPPESGRWDDSACTEEDAKHEGDWENAPPGALYEWSAAAPPSERLALLSVKEEGGSQTLVKGDLGSNDGSTRGAISADGSRVFWTEQGGGLYMRDTAREETMRLDVVGEGAFGTGAEAPLFQGADAAGTVAFFTDTRNLTPDANEEGADLYRWQAPGSGSCEELGGCLSDLSANGAESAEVLGLAAGMGEDGASVYFLARGVLASNAGAALDASGEAQHAAPGQPNLYLWRQGQGTRFIATLSEADSRVWGSFGGVTFAAQQSAAASPSGRYLAFMSAQPLTGYDNRDARSGEADQEVFRYDSQTGELLCASCDPSGARPAGLRGREGEEQTAAFDPLELWRDQPLAATLPEASKLGLNGPVAYRPRAVQDDGRLFFNAADSLVPADANANWDVYEYEPTGLGSCGASGGGASAELPGGSGCVSLLSSGSGEEEAAFLDASEGGGDVFFLTSAPLSVLDEDRVADVYDARVGGVPATLNPSAECLGEACQPPATPPPTQTPASAAFRGPGNPPLGGKGRHCPKGKRKVRRRGKVRCAQRHRHRKRHAHHHRRHHRHGRRSR